MFSDLSFFVCFCFLVSIILQFMWTFFIILFWFIYTIFVYICTNFLVIALLHIHDLIYHSLLVPTFYQFEWSIETLFLFKSLLSLIHNVIFLSITLHTLRTIPCNVKIFVSTVRQNVENSREEVVCYLPIFFLFPSFFWPDVPRFLFKSLPFWLKKYLKPSF